MPHTSGGWCKVEKKSVAEILRYMRRHSARVPKHVLTLGQGILRHCVLLYHLSLLYSMPLRPLPSPHHPSYHPMPFPSRHARSRSLQFESRAPLTPQPSPLQHQSARLQAFSIPFELLRAVRGYARPLQTGSSPHGVQWWIHRLYRPFPPCSSMARNSWLRMRRRKRRVWTRNERRNRTRRGRKVDRRRSWTAGRVYGSNGEAPSHPKTSGRGIKTRVRLPFLQ